MSKVIILTALMLLIALCIPITSADAIGTYINQGATIFIGEDGLDITNTGVTDTIGWWKSGSDIMRTSPDRTISVTNRKTSFSVTPAEFSDALGNWYRLLPNGKPDMVMFNVQEPYLNLQVWNKDTNNIIYNNKVSSGTHLTFKLNTNLHYVTDRRYADWRKLPMNVKNTTGFVNIKVVSPSGSTYTKLIGSDVSLQDIFINSSEQKWDGTWDTDAFNSNDIRAYPAGEYKIYADTNFNHIKDNYNRVGKTITDTQTLTISQSSVSITINKESIVRGNPFTITVSGNPKTLYHIWITKTHDMADSSPPRIYPNQEGVEIGSGGNHVSTYGTSIINDVPSSPSPNPYYADVTTDETGSRIISFSTSVNTSSRKYTIRVESDDTSYGKTYDEADITVVNGGLTIVANGDQTYYLGETVKFEGINTETHTTYLFMYGPNLPIEGARMHSSDPRHFEVTNNDASTFKQVNVNGDGTWKWDWVTSSLALDAGTYIIYAVSLPKSKSHLMEATYATTSVKFSKPTLTVSVPPSVAKGDPIKIKGYAEGQPSRGVAIWIMGTNYNKRITTTVGSDSSFEYELTRASTESMSAGQYFVVVQHPMQNSQFDIVLNTDGSISNLQLGNNGSNIFQFGGSGSLQGSDAAHALVKAIEDPNIDDTYVKAYFTISNPIITIDNIGDKYISEKFTLTGRTNLNTNTQLTIDIISSTFKPTNKSEPNEFSGASIITQVVSDDNSSGYNKFTAAIDTSTFKPDEYIVTVSAIENDATATTLFIVKNGIRPASEKVTTLRTIPPSTQIPTIIPTNTTTPAPIPTKSSLIPGVPGLPGFTSIIAIFGLLIVIIFIQRK